MNWSWRAWVKSLPIPDYNSWEILYLWLWVTHPFVYKIRKAFQMKKCIATVFAWYIVFIQYICIFFLFHQVEGKVFPAYSLGASFLGLDLFALCTDVLLYRPDPRGRLTVVDIKVEYSLKVEISLTVLLINRNSTGPKQIRFLEDVHNFIGWHLLNPKCPPTVSSPNH